jgi:hypothetical protein
MVEGETDVQYLKLAIQHLSPDLQTMLDQDELRIIYKLDGAGTTQLCDWALAWIYSGFRSKMYILLDKDTAGKKARKEIISGEAYKTRHQSLSMKITNIQPSDAVINLNEKHIAFLYEIEHLCSAEVWQGWKTQNLVELRTDAEMRSMFNGLIPRDKSLDNIVDELVDDVAVRDTILTFEPKKLKKKRMVAYLKEHFCDNINAFAGFSRTIKEIEEYFVVKLSQ